MLMLSYVFVAHIFRILCEDKEKHAYFLSDSICLLLTLLYQNGNCMHVNNKQQLKQFTRAICMNQQKDLNNYNVAQ